MYNFDARVFIWYCCLYDLARKIEMHFIYTEWTMKQLYSRIQTTDNNAQVKNNGQGLVEMSKNIKCTGSSEYINVIKRMKDSLLLTLVLSIFSFAY